MTTLAPILATADLDRSVRFYVEVLGFTCGLQLPGYANLTRDGVRIMLRTPDPHAPWTGPRLTGQLYIQLGTPAEVDALWAAVRDRAAVAYPPEDFDYGMREFGIRDDSGYDLAFGAPR